MAIAIFTHADGVFQNPILLGASEAARKHQTNLIVFRSPTMGSYSDLDAQRMQSQYNVDRADLDGLILSYSAPGLTQYGLSLYREGLRVVSIGRTLEDLPTVLLENAAAIRDLVLDLYSRGHRAIAHLAGPDDNQCARDRLAGYREGLRRAGLPEDPRLILQGRFEEGPSYAAVRSAWQNGLRFTALVCANDLSAVGALKALKEAGVAVPQEIEVTGFDNSVACKVVQPMLSTFSTNNFELGYLATDQILRGARGEQFPLSTTLPVDFIARQSTRSAIAAGGRGAQQGGFWSMPPREANLWLTRLRNINATEPILRQLTVADSSEEFVAAAEAVLGLAEANAIPPACLHDEFARVADRNARVTPLATAAALERVHASMLCLEYRQAELSAQFNLHATQLRQATIRPTEESILLQEMRRVLWELRVPHAEIYLSAENSPNDSGRFDAVSWHADETRPGFREEFRQTAFSFRELMREQAGPAGSWMVVPLIFHDVQYGVAAVSRETPYEFLLPELIRLFSTAIHANRAHRALVQANRDLERSRNAAEEANAELKRLQAKLVETSRLAGIAEVATGILHNLGNALNSVNTSANLAIDHVRNFKFRNLERVVQLIEEHRAELDRFVREDPRGNQAFNYLKALSEALVSEQEAVIAELACLRSGIERANGIVAEQQSHAHVSPVAEDVLPAELIECALQICEGAFRHHQVSLLREITAVPTVRLQRQKTLQILINLLNNATEAVTVNPVGERRVVVSLRPIGATAFQILVEDNGVGIAKEDLTRIFAFGFTTKEGKRGFSLHNSALAAHEMKGSLSAKSEGPGKGATLVLDLPVSA